MSEEIQRSRTFELKDPVSGAEVKFSQLPTGNYKITMNTDGEFSEDMWEAMYIAMKEMYNT
ncbi:MAG: hypothetical protein GY928_15650 [Colwellia sp.]|nr:hypothetical protein [Colwellia sp.]